MIRRLIPAAIGLTIAAAVIVTNPNPTAVTYLTAALWGGVTEEILRRRLRADTPKDN